MTHEEAQAAVINEVKLLLAALDCNIVRLEPDTNRALVLETRLRASLAVLESKR